MTNSRDPASLSLRQWDAGGTGSELTRASVALDCGWGRLLFGQTFSGPRELAETLLAESEGKRDIAFYVREPHVMLSLEPQALFLDPSHTYRLALEEEVDRDPPLGFSIRSAWPEDLPDINRVYSGRGMVPIEKGFLDKLSPDSPHLVLVAEDTATPGHVVGVVMGVDHRRAFEDPEAGSSLWALAVDVQAAWPGVGAALTTELAELLRRQGCRFMDLSVMHDNGSAIHLYEKLGFERVPVFCVKTRNAINQSLYIGPPPGHELNIYARVIIDEARRRGVAVDVEDEKAGLFTLTLGSRSISCRESLSDLTSAVAMSRCDDKALTRRLLQRTGIDVPDQVLAGSSEINQDFLEKHKRIVAKPARGEQGRGVFVDLRSMEAVERAVEIAREQCDQVILEEFVEGEDLRIIVIDSAVVAAALRRPAEVIGDGHHSISTLIEKQSRRRAAATGGEGSIPVDAETERCIADAGYTCDDILPEGMRLAVRKTANLHTGGTIHDVTPQLHPALGEAAILAARTLSMPVVGFDFMVEAPNRPFYRVIEANERPGLANHGPAPTVERFVDFLFPETRYDKP
ncbi:Glutathione synthase [Parvibaculum lavamentivorans DS-1]|uniref:Glutathione synthase n=1 Tax=Parvibaculum lavamentivorans (strain DS-1 / DSM 13023 / NCIMB 13966) TaxID=402881 RepID=A7HRA5_PARL1|nr:N-acetylglutaminylglutamine synthetase [Parvibaculum lavamentivorans]ABS62438.1 Glutathione synthase [Parvibaculum lavamentivorans DS-1]